MKNLLLSVLLMLFVTAESYSQNSRVIQGITQDSAGLTLPGVSVKLISASDSIGTVSDFNGNFTLKGVKAPKFRLKVTAIGFKPFTKEYTVDQKAPLVKLSPITLKDAFNQLNEVVIVAVTPVKLKEDTVEYDARAFKVREGDAVEEMVKKLPGLEVSKDGAISTQGQAITKVRLNGKDFFGDDAKAALQNLPADIVKNLQVIDDYGDQANITGIKTEEPRKILNINTKPDKRNGYFGRAEGGMGTASRYASRLRANRFQGDRQLSFDGVLGNTLGRSEGTTDSKALKFNFRDKWGKKLESYGSYRFNNSDNRTTEQVYSQNIFQNYTRFDDENNVINRIENEHRLNWNFEYEINKNNYLKVEPNLSYSPSRSTNTGTAFSQLLSSNSRKVSTAANKDLSAEFGSQFFFNHKFARQGRNLSIGAELSYNQGEQNRSVNNEFVLTDSLNNVSQEGQNLLTLNNNSVRRARVRFSYIEPLSKVSFLELNYDWNRSHTENLRDASDIDPLSGEKTINPQLSNNYNYDFTTNRVGLTYRYSNTSLNYIVGLSAQPGVLRGEDLSRNLSTSNSNFNWIPTARLVYKFSKKHSLIARYFGRNNQPSFNQLQPVTDNSNLQNTITGNPDLKPEFIHNAGLEYRQSDISSGYTMFTNVSISSTENKIVTRRVIIPDSLKQETSFINTGGFYNTQGSYSFSKPFASRKFTISYSGGANYSNNIAFTNNERNVGRNLVLSQGLKLRFDLEDIIDAQINTTYSYNKTSYSSSSFSDRKTNRYNVSFEGRNYFFKDLTLGYDFSKTFNSGYNTGNVNPTLLSLYLEHRFLKGNRGSVRLQGFDLFNQNTGIERDVFDNEIVDRQNNRLARYFLLSFQYRLQKFGV